MYACACQLIVACPRLLPGIAFICCACHVYFVEKQRFSLQQVDRYTMRMCACVHVSAFCAVLFSSLRVLVELAEYYTSVVVNVLYCLAPFYLQYLAAVF